jgi:hypothetical protein
MRKTNQIRKIRNKIERRKTESIEVSLRRKKIMTNGRVNVIHRFGREEEQIKGIREISASDAGKHRRNNEWMTLLDTGSRNNLINKKVVEDNK